MAVKYWGKAFLNARIWCSRKVNSITKNPKERLFLMDLCGEAQNVLWKKLSEGGFIKPVRTRGKK